MKPTLVTIFLLFGVFFGVATAQYPRGRSDSPRLVVGIVVEQMRSDYLSRFWDKFGEGGFKRLVNGGTYCSNASFSHFYTQTAPGYATIYTGSAPASHGIVANEWYDRQTNRTITAAGDETVRTVGGAFEAGRFSPRQLLPTTVGDELRLSNFKLSRVFSVSLDPASAVLAGGHTANGAFWYDDENGTWATSSYYMQRLPDWMEIKNAERHADKYLEMTWDTSFPVLEYIGSDESAYETGIAGRFVFPYVLPEIAGRMSFRDRYRMLKQTPFGNTLTKDLAIATIIHENLGKGRNTDMIAISFAATEHIGNAFGPISVEVEDAFVKLDRDLEHLLQFIDEHVGRQNTLIFLTSNHGAAMPPGYVEYSKAPAGTFNANSAISLLRSYLNALYGNGDWISGYFGQQLYLNTDLIESLELKLEDVREAVAQFLIQFTGVSNTLTATTLQHSQFTEGYRRNMQNNFYPRRSGCVFINLHPGWVERSNHATAHNSAYPYDTRVPLIWYGWNVRRNLIIRPIDMTDVATTISAMLNIMVPNAATGAVIEELVTTD